MPRTIIIGTASESKTYQEVQQLPDYVFTYYGKTLTAEDIFVIEGSLAEGDYIDYEDCEFKSTSKIYDVGTIDNELKKFKIRNKSGDNVTDSYAIEFEWGTLQITAV